MTKDGNKNLESICGARSDYLAVGHIDSKTRAFTSTATHLSIPNIRKDERYYINVYGKVSIPNSNEEEIVPYEPFELHIKDSGIVTLANCKTFSIILFHIYLTLL